jgi:hypothetical protein
VLRYYFQKLRILTIILLHVANYPNLISFAVQTNSVFLLCRGAKYFPEICEPYQHSRRKKGNMKQVTCWRHVNFRRHLTKFCCHGTHAPGVCAPLFLRMGFGLKEQYRLDVSKECNIGECIIIKATVIVHLFVKTLTQRSTHHGCLSWIIFVYCNDIFQNSILYLNNRLLNPI